MENQEKSLTLSSVTRANFEYLVATLSSRTKGKKYENFIINYLWHSLNDPTLKPVTQQYVSRTLGKSEIGLLNLTRKKAVDDSNHALIDLYFPALHLGIECDEAQHIANTEADSKRSADIRNVIDDYLEIRILVELDKENNPVSPETVMDQLDQAVETIKQRKAEVLEGKYAWGNAETVTWKSDLPDWKQALRAGILRASDGYLFRHNGEVRELFGNGDGTGNKKSNFQTSFVPKTYNDGHHRVWAPILAVKDAEGGLISQNSVGTLNIVFEKNGQVYVGETIQEKWQNREPKDDPMDWAHVKRITFAKVRDSIGRTGFQFIGVLSTKPEPEVENIDGHEFVVRRVVQDQINLPPIPSGN